MKKINKAAVLLCVVSLSAVAADKNADLIKKLEVRVGAGEIETITKTPYGELYEVKTKRDVIYTDKEGKYLFAGRVIDTASGKNLTEERLDDINKVDFKSLPLDLALKYTKGNGKRVFAIFEDPNCGYCKKFRKTLQDMDNVTVYTFQYNILTEESKTKSRDIWCMPDRSKAWDEWMLNNKAPVTAAASCTSPSDKVLELGKKYRIQGTPAIIFTDGSRIPGAVDVKTMEDKLAKLAS
ncbi:DsbC family protein [Undibacterium sp. RTI2.1]|uniref:DsbC family protein n=1 Tax=unclassified Undibacterium TaxID=2630295 RepID=UPI002B22D94C|nr:MULTISPECIES: DsbC family protein [unclassified Undibacterium]MEB0032981.1 DsbC family protein [Undibacterium sp. RTI2.1]MEB0118846.1 DsbC family protein [Undibacterium sp. RTI2.2]